MRINNFTHVTHPDLGPVQLEPGEVPEWAVSLILNPALIVSDEPVGDEGLAEPEADPEGTEPEEVETPKKGSSATKWAEYAASKGFEVDDDATASSIREALDAEGIPTE